MSAEWHWLTGHRDDEPHREVTWGTIALAVVISVITVLFVLWCTTWLGTTLR